MYYKTCNIDRKASISSFKVCYSLHPNLPILWQSVTKIIETRYTFIQKVHRKTSDLLKVTQNPPSSWLNVVPSVRSHVRQWRTEMNSQFATNIEWGGGEASLTIFVIDCRSFLVEFSSWSFLFFILLFFTYFFYIYYLFFIKICSFAIAKFSSGINCCLAFFILRDVRLRLFP